MARKPTPEAPSAAPASNRQSIIDALLALLAEKPIEDIGFGEVATRAGVPLAEMREEFGSLVGVIAAHMKEVDRKVLAGIDADMAEEPARERLFDVLMRRIETLSAHKEAIRSLIRSAGRNPGLCFALNGLAVRSQLWMLTAAGIDSSGPRGMIRAQGLAMLFAGVLRTWMNDEDPGHARTMAALDRALARGGWWAGVLDELCRFSPTRFCPGSSRRRRQRTEYEGDEPVAV